MKPSILVSRKFSEKWLPKLREKFDVTVWDKDSTADRSWLLDNIQSKDGALVMLTDRVDKEFMARGSSLKVISTMSVGYDHIDTAAAKARNITVTNTPGVLTDSTADLGFALLLSTSRRITEGDRSVRSGEWKEAWSPSFMLGKEVSGKTLGLYGMGRIGQAVARRAEAFGMRVIYNSRSRKEISGADFVDFDTLLRESDFVMICVSLNDETRDSINNDAFIKMKEDSILVNISRGPIINQNDLYHALKEGLISGAGIDVYEEEPLPDESPLKSLNNVVLTPHIGSATYETRDKMAELAVKNLTAVLEGQEPKHRVT